MRFVPGLDLSQAVYENTIRSVMAAEFPGLAYAAATLGMCSEVLGLDDAVSRDHEWGPRVTVFLREGEHSRWAEEVMSALRASLPAKLMGLDTMWRRPGVDLHDTSDVALYHISVRTVADALASLGWPLHLPPEDVEWLRVSEQHLLEFTSGVVYCDQVGELTRARTQLSYYPDNVLRYLLMHEWTAVNADWSPIGRIGTRGDDLGLRVQAAKVAHHLMRIAYMISRRYAPYAKWFGTLFSRLPVSREMRPVLAGLLSGRDWQQIEESICEATLILLRYQNERVAPPKITVERRVVDDGRHHITCDYRGIAASLRASVAPPLKALIENRLPWRHGKSLIFANGEVGKCSLWLQRDDRPHD